MHNLLSVSLLSLALTAAATPSRADTAPGQKISLVTCALTPSANGAGLLDPAGLLYVLGSFGDLIGAGLGDTATVDVALQVKGAQGALPALVSYSGFKLGKGAAPHTLTLTGDFEGQALTAEFSTSGELQPAKLVIGTETVAAKCSAFTVED